MTGVAGVPDEEVFGPLLRVWRYDSFEEAILMANNTRFELSAVWFPPAGKIRSTVAGGAGGDC